jgi:hypothetical protein
MLGQVVMPMSLRFQFAPFPGRPAVRSIPAQWARAAKVALRTLALLGCAASVALLQAQTSAPSANPGAAVHAPVVPAFPMPGLGTGTAAFGPDRVQTQYQPADPFGSGSFRPRQGNGSTLDPFQPRHSFGSFSGATGSGMDFSEAGGFGMGRQGSGSFYPIVGSGPSGHSNSLAPLFPAGSAFSPIGVAPLALPSFNQLMRGSFGLPLNSAQSSFRLTYQDAIRPGVNFGDLARPNTSLIFSTTDLGNGMFLTAGTGFGHSTAGAPAAGLGSSTSGDAKHSGPSVAVKLSF